MSQLFDLHLDPLFLLACSITHSLIFIEDLYRAVSCITYSFVHTGGLCSLFKGLRFCLTQKAASTIWTIQGLPSHSYDVTTDRSPATTLHKIDSFFFPASSIILLFSDSPPSLQDHLIVLHLALITAPAEYRSRPWPPSSPLVVLFLVFLFVIFVIIVDELGH